jgi:hypothetical protein
MLFSKTNDKQCNKCVNLIRFTERLGTCGFTKFQTPHKAQVVIELKPVENKHLI